MKKILYLLLTLALFASITTITSFAFTIPDTAVSCTITTNQSYNYSTYVVGTHKYFGGQNYSSSNRKLTVAAEYFDGSSDKYLTDTYEYVDIGSEFSEMSTKKYSGPLCWRVYLKPYGWASSGCSGCGYIRNK